MVISSATLLAGVLLLSQSSIFYASAWDSRLPQSLFGRRTKAAYHNTYYGRKWQVEEHASSESVVEHFTVTQPIDHNDPSMGNWSQRADYNGQYYKENADGDVIFLMIGGEGTIADVWVTGDYSYVRWAQKYGAAIFQLEHRFFGYSRPYNDMKVSSLKFCTIAQAIDDIASFIQQMNALHNYKNPKWVTFGGSYPGALNAWHRAKYPTLTAGAVASSAIIGLKLDFFDYAMVMEKTLKRTSEECRDKAENAFKVIIGKTLTAEGRQQLNTVFKLDPPFNENNVTLHDLQTFIYNLYNEFWVVIQYTYDGRNSDTEEGLTVKNLCAQLTNASIADDPLLQMKALIDWEDTFFGFGFADRFPNSYKDTVSEFQNETYDDETNAERAAARGWYWLCCNEMGFHMTTDQGHNVFGNLLPLNFFIDMCTDMFGMTIETIRNKNIQARKDYPGRNAYDATNVILPSGSLDPWSSVGAYRSDTSKHLIALIINGTAHCADMYPTYDGEPTELPPARDQIEKEIEYYIGYVAPTKGASIPRPNLNSFFTSIAFVTLAVWMR